MAQYTHISRNNTSQALCGVVTTDNIYFLFWNRATCPRCRAAAEKNPKRVCWPMGTPEAEMQPAREWEPAADGRPTAGGERGE